MCVCGGGGRGGLALLDLTHTLVLSCNLSRLYWLYFYVLYILLKFVFVTFFLMFTPLPSLMSIGC